jgi:hypothetical protein
MALYGDYENNEKCIANPLIAKTDASSSQTRQKLAKAVFVSPDNHPILSDLLSHHSPQN